jgi:hypothetical protein
MHFICCAVVCISCATRPSLLPYYTFFTHIRVATQAPSSPAAVFCLCQQPCPLHPSSTKGPLPPTPASLLPQLQQTQPQGVPLTVAQQVLQAAVQRRLPLLLLLLLLPLCWCYRASSAAAAGTGGGTGGLWGRWSPCRLS